MDGLPPELRRWALAAIFTALALVSLDTAIANIALPAIAADLHVSPADVVWVVNAYQIALVATLLPLGALGEIVGHHRIYFGGLFLFTLRRSAAPGVVAAEPARRTNAAGIGRGRPHGRERGAGAFRLSDHCLAAASAKRAVRGDRLHVRTDDRLRHSGARPLAVAVRDQHSVRHARARGSASKTLPQTPRATHNFDFRRRAGGKLSWPLHHRDRQRGTQGPRRRWWRPNSRRRSLLGWILIRRNADHPAPMLPIDLFRRPMFALSAATSVCSFAAQGLAFVSLPFYFEDVLGRRRSRPAFS